MTNYTWILVIITFYALWTWMQWRRFQQSDADKMPLRVYIGWQMYATYMAILSVIAVIYWNNMEFMRMMPLLCILGLLLFFITDAITPKRKQ